jgi:hypothetical protein
LDISPFFWSRLVTEFHVEPIAKLVNLIGAEWRVLVVAEVVAGVGFAQFEWLVEADGRYASGQLHSFRWL